MTAVTQGYKPGDFDLIVINASPCGGCRQWHVEFKVDRVIFANNDGELVEYTADELLPDTFVSVVKSGFVAIAGRPNVGKSSLVNAICGGKVTIVSDKPQTTRRRVFGIANGDDYQLVLADLPGFQRPLDPLTERMQRTVDSSFEDLDARDAGRRLPRPHRRRRPLHRAARLRARGAGRDRRQQGRPPEAGPHRHTDAGGREARRLPRAPPGQREDGRRDRRAARGARRAAARGAAVLPAGPEDRPLGRGRRSRS